MIKLALILLLLGLLIAATISYVNISRSEDSVSVELVFKDNIMSIDNESFFRRTGITKEVEMNG